MFSPLKHCYNKSLDRLLECLCSSEEKAVWKWIYFWLPQKVTEQGCYVGNQVLFPEAEASNFNSVSSCLQLAMILSTCRHPSTGLESLKATIRTAFWAPWQKASLHTHKTGKDRPWGNSTTVHFKVRTPQKVNSSYLLEVTVAHRRLLSIKPKESPSINSLPAQADHHACWRTTSTEDWATKTALLRRKGKGQSGVLQDSYCPLLSHPPLFHNFSSVAQLYQQHLHIQFQC